MQTGFTFLGIKSNKPILKISLLSFLITVMLFSQYLFANEQETSPTEIMVKNIHWLGQAAIKITVGEKTIYIDPYQLKKKDKADIILITHKHGDHFSPEDISKILTKQSILIAPQTCKEDVKNIKVEKKLYLEPGKDIMIEDIKIEAVPAYNVVKTKFHPKSNHWLGYILTMDGVRIYHAGDTERIPEMKNFDADIALLPLGQTYTMNSVKEAAESALDTKVKIAIPMHFGKYEGSSEDAEEFKKILKDKVKVIILKEE